MGRRKIEMKRIQDKSSRLVTFSKRRTGLFEKARQLSVLCDVQAAVVVFSAGGKLYEFCTGDNSAENVIFKHQKDETTIQKASVDPCTKFRTCKELLQTVDRLVEENNIDAVSVTDMMQLSEELGDALVQTRSRKTQLMMEYVSTLRGEEKRLGEEKEQLLKQIASENQNEGDDGGLSIKKSPQHVTLPLFN